MTSRRREQASSRQLAQIAEVMSSPRRYIIGIDEVGYGSWAGPLYVAGAVFLKGWGDPEVKDSKAYSGHPARRKVLVTKIMPNVVHHVIFTATNAEIDANGLGKTLNKLMHRVAESCFATVPDSLIVVDGSRHIHVNGAESYAIPKADALVPAVSAASVIAKTARDEHMELLSEKYPGYGFSKNRGYGSPVHAEAIERLGVCAIHRKSFRIIREFIEHGVLSYMR
jgi:ribonuclease HII